MWHKDTYIDHEPDFKFSLKIIFMSDKSIHDFWNLHHFDKELLEKAIEQMESNPYRDPKRTTMNGSPAYKRTVAQFYSNLFFEKNKAWPSFQ